MTNILRYTLLGIADLLVVLAAGLGYATDGLLWAAKAARAKADSLK